MAEVLSTPDCIICMKTGKLPGSCGHWFCDNCCQGEVDGRRCPACNVGDDGKPLLFWRSESVSEEDNTSMDVEPVVPAEEDPDLIRNPVSASMEQAVEERERQDREQKEKRAKKRSEDLKKFEAANVLVPRPSTSTSRKSKPVTSSVATTAPSTSAHRISTSASCSRCLQVTEKLLFCRDCRSFLCANCHTEVHDQGDLAKHRIIEMKPESHPELLYADLNCAPHSKPRVYFCSQHDERVCETCFLNRHTSCSESIILLPGSSAEQIFDCVRKDILRGAADSLNRSKELYQRSHTHVQQVVYAREKSLAQTKQFFDSVIEIINKRQADVVRNITTTLDARLEKLHTQEQVCEGQYLTKQNLMESLARLDPASNPNEAAKELLSQMRSLQEAVNQKPATLLPLQDVPMYRGNVKFPIPGGLVQEPLASVIGSADLDSVSALYSPMMTLGKRKPLNYPSLPLPPSMQPPAKKQITTPVTASLPVISPKQNLLSVPSPTATTTATTTTTTAMNTQLPSIKLTPSTPTDIVKGAAARPPVSNPTTPSQQSLSVPSVPSTTTTTTTTSSSKPGARLSSSPLRTAEELSSSDEDEDEEEDSDQSSGADSDNHEEARKKPRTAAEVYRMRKAAALEVQAACSTITPPSSAMTTTTITATTTTTPQAKEISPQKSSATPSSN